ncbi:hypothetical protein, variant [Capsaspora owczarzaki ATCC 30864]|uniref:hypothetical protein, variant n=1 Tax=Capsaspora owczarzaki (strain ATCC 30864) TaxID=595528 RepID=UPI000352480C|nr:hypothetical protein, variant [Capsaspora owczarzaki ATCC 30864]|eukprot:XP_011269973.1 hypothetical protein, variant [Capsaspora owczarzaki ATCC 30864]
MGRCDWHQQTAGFLEKYKKTRKQRRSELPMADIKVSPSFWSVMKNSIGKDLSKIAMPIDFNEPLSLLQRLVEDFEYASMLDRASASDNPFERLAFVAAFSLTAYATSEGRTGKPFNPLLGETYECVREDRGRGWRYLSEQVSHHPPISACHCDAPEWECWQEYRLGSKFRGQYLKVNPEGPVHLKLKMHGEHYSWTKPVTTIHNMIVGKLWIDHEGEITVRNHLTGDRAVLTIQPWHVVGKDFKNVRGGVFDHRGNKVMTISGTWDGSLVASPVDQPKRTIELWKVVPRRSNSIRSYFGFTDFSMQLNELEPGLCPTDSRLRPDQRLMEVGDLANGTQEKLRLEEKQRAARRQREVAQQPWIPKWFTRRADRDTKEVLWVYRGGYWDAKQSGQFGATPNIF